MDKSLVVISANSLHTAKFTNAVAKKFEKIYLITHKDSKDFPYDSPPNMETIEINFKSLLASITIFKILKKIKPDLMHIHQANHYAFHSFLANKLLNIPTILTVWGSDVLVFPYMNPIYKKMLKFNLNNAKTITADSYNLIREAKKYVKTSKNYKVIKFGIEDSFFNSCSNSINFKENIILSNRLHKKHYNIDLIIKGFAKIITKYPDWKLIIVGNDETETPLLKELVKELKIDKNVDFVGVLKLSELQEYYKKSKIFTSIPKSDGLSVSLLEAMAAGNIPVLNNLAPNLELIIDEINGIISNDISSMDISLIKAIKMSEDNQTYNNLIEWNRNILIKQGVLSVCSNQINELYEQFYKI
ncbi:MAG: glycosyltransferase family 4 protein [bacterium]